MKGQIDDLELLTKAQVSLFYTRVLKYSFADFFHQYIKKCGVDFSYDFKYADVSIDFKAVLLKPFIAAFIMGAATIVAYKLSFTVLGSNTLAVLISMIAAVLVYFVTVFKTGAVTKDDIVLIPKGELIYKFALKMKITK